MRTINIVGSEVILRAVEPEDLDLMYVWENDRSMWEHGETRVPYSRHQLQQFIESQSQDLGRDGQLRLVICAKKEREFRGDTIIEAGETIGAIDIFGYDPHNHRAGVGVLIDPAYRGRAHASDALRAVESYLVSSFNLHQVWCDIGSDNIVSLALFKRCGYEVVGVKRDWCRRGREFVDEVLLQKIL